MNYRCVVLFGRAERVTDRPQMRAVSAGLIDHLASGRSADARPPTDEELRATTMIRLPVDEGTAKVRTGGPIEQPADLDRRVWAGELPVGLSAGVPVSDERGRDPIPPPLYIADRLRRA